MVRRKAHSNFCSDEVWQLESQRSQLQYMLESQRSLEQANMLLRCQLDYTRLVQEQYFLQQQLQLRQRRIQSWFQDIGKSPARHSLGKSITRGSQRKIFGSARDQTAEQGKARMIPDPTFPQAFAMIEQSTIEPSSLPVSFSASESSSIVGEMTSVENRRTTCVVRNMPEDYTRQKLLDLIDNVGFAGKYNLVYLPMDFKNKTNLGYAFVDLVSDDVALKFFETFSGFCDCRFSIEKEFEVSWSTVQGYLAHIERYRNSPVMHQVVPDDFKPVLFVDGQQVPFPEPTKPIPEPRKRKGAITSIRSGVDSRKN